jgi:hypothetical protein
MRVNEGELVSGMKLPRELEADGTADAICQALTARTIELSPGGEFSVPVITLGDPLKKILQRANLNGQILRGFEAISDKLARERKGIDHLQERRDLPTGERVSRLILVTNDGAQRFYHHIEHLLKLHAPRLLGCMLDTDSVVLGSLISGREKQIKVIMVDRKGVVSEILRTLLADQ